MIGLGAQVSLYPLDQADLAPAIDALLAVLENHGLDYIVGSMSTQIWGDDETLFAALREGFAAAAEQGPAVMVVTVSNACPVLPQGTGVLPQQGGA
jgi:uncharacterized protein YqgV (UPF0045/DUF77 family)